jgi:signal transduction histidine kinase/CheY-like chemotaxis protein/PAS domain-containing protein
MSKKKINKRLETIFTGVEAEQAKAVSRPKKLTGILRSPIPPSSARPKAGPPIAMDPQLGDTSALTSAVQNSSGAMSLAFRTDEKSWATLRVTDDSAPRTWAVEDQMLVKQVADQLSLALENARLFKDTQARAEELAILNEMGHELTSPLQIGGIYETVYKYTSLLMDTTDFLITVYDKEQDLISLPFAVLENKRVNILPRKLGQGLTDHILRTKQPIFFSDSVTAHMKANGIESSYIGTEKPALCWLGVPLLAGDQILGVISLHSISVPKLYTERHRDLLVAIAGQAAIALENARLFQITEQSEHELRTLFTSMTDVILILRRDGTYMRIAPTNPSRLIAPPQDLLGKKLTDLLPEVAYRPMMVAIRKALLGGEPVKYEYELPVDNHNYWFDATVSKLDNDNVFWVARDITERKIAEKAIERRNEYLAAAAEIGRLVTSTLDLDTIFTRTVNLVGERFGFPHAAIFVVEETGFNAVLREATGVAGAEMKRLQHSLGVDDRSIVGKVVFTGEPVVVNNVALDHIHKPNPLLPQTKSEAGIPLRVGSRIIGALDIQSNKVDAFSTDDLAVLQILADQVAVAIDNARSYELSQQAVMEMREVDRLKSQFLANMSHELRTPLNSIIGFSRVILKGIDGHITDLQQQDLTAIYNSGQHLLGLINDVLDLAKIEAGKIDLSFDDVNIADIITSVMSTTSGLVKDKSIKLVRNVHGDLPSVRADPIRIRQVLLNLLSNAAKFTDDGQITVDALVDHNEDGRAELVVSVTDTGPGISEEDQTKLFQRFSQVDDSPTRKTGGSGLGLSISQQLIQMHGGRIGVHSTVGQGSTFYFTLPIDHDEGEAIEAGDKKVILAIDDDPQVIALYERFLTPQGYQVVGLTDPTRAKERVRKLKPFAITLDIMMPGYDGWSVLNDLKSNSTTRDIPVVICSIIEEQERGFSLGAVDYLLKPIMEDDLLGALDRVNSDGKIREVLVVDDDLNALRLMGKFFHDHHRYRLTTAVGGQQGWDMISMHTPDAVILDLLMPDVNGFAILEKMRESPKLRDLPVVVVSGVDPTPDQQRQLTEFGQHLISKGTLNEKDLLAALERALQHLEVKK